MSSFNNSSQVKQFGSILRGFGPPAPTAGLVGDLYLDVQTNFLYAKREAEATDPWGNYLFAVPVNYAPTLKWFSAAAPTNDFGLAGDYCLAWAGYANYGTGPSLYGPKAAYGWPEIGEGPDTNIDPTYAGYAIAVGLADEGAALPLSSSSQLIVTGLLDEYILAIPVVTAGGTSISQLGLPEGPVSAPMNLNPQYSAVNEHAV